MRQYFRLTTEQFKHRRKIVILALLFFAALC
jgi:hypothetical protein